MAAVCGWAIVLVGLLPLLVLSVPDAHFGAAFALQCAVVAHTGGALTRVLTDTRVRLAALGFWLFSYVWLGLAPLAMLATGTYSHEYRADAGTAFAATALTELGLLAYGIGAALARRRTAGRSALLEPLLSRRLAPVPVLLLSVLALLLGIALIPRLGGAEAFFTSRQAVQQSGAANDSVRELATWSLSVPAFWALAALVHLPRVTTANDRLLRNLRLLLIPPLTGLNLIVNNPISRPRFWAGTVLLVLLFASGRFSRPRAYRLAAAALTVTVLLVFPYSDYFRYDQRGPVHVVSLTAQFTTKMDYDAFQQMQTGIDYVHQAGFTPSAALGPALFMVPRSVWPGKPQDTGVGLAEWAGYTVKNLSAPLWIESYIWAGVPCVAAVFCLLGAAGRRMDDLRERLRSRGATLAVLLVPAFAFYQLIFLRGSLMGVVGPLSLLLTLPFLFTTSAARSSRSAAPDLPTARPDRTPIFATGGIRDLSRQLR
ncbi:hypothetical protein [Streptomyces sp. NPDC048191]|uniref:hypothetical protein n=1 Tax=Streptomyces sp. NPDC048191 TaxID=3155484 RepID=UPI0033E34BFE